MKNLFKRLKENKKGFSLVELIVVIAIMAILVGVLGVTFIPYIEKSREGMDIDTLGKVKSVVESAVLTSEDVEALKDKYVAVEDLYDSYPIIEESVPSEMDVQCTCSDDELKVYIYVDEEGKTITAYYSADGSAVYSDTKDGVILATNQDFVMPSTAALYTAPADEG